MAEKTKEKAEKKPKKSEAPAKKPKKAAAKHKKKEKIRACKIEGCKQSYRAKGYCRKHYRKWRHGEYGKVRYRACKENECHRPTVINRHGYCEEHYIQHYVKKIASAPPVAEETTQEAQAS
ncbi:MAG: hypothetical protein KDD51_00840 [Bdellovibrionales bacterium]|nr:hypothetical protein [Bdellovibrionales bacterium]